MTTEYQATTEVDDETIGVLAIETTGAVVRSEGSEDSHVVPFSQDGPEMCSCNAYEYQPEERPCKHMKAVQQLLTEGEIRSPDAQDEWDVDQAQLDEAEGGEVQVTLTGESVREVRNAVSTRMAEIDEEIGELKQEKRRLKYAVQQLEELEE